MLAHEILVVLSRRCDTRFRKESLSAWVKMIMAEQWACRKTPLPDDSSDDLGIDVQLTDSEGRAYLASTAPSVNTLWRSANHCLGHRHYVSQYELLVTGLRSSDSRDFFIAPGLVAHLPYPNYEFLKHRYYILDVYAGEEFSAPAIVFVIRRHWGHNGVTPPYMLSANRLAHDILSNDWSKPGPLWWWKRVIHVTDAHGEPQSSVRMASS